MPPEVPELYSEDGKDVEAGDRAPSLRRSSNPFVNLGPSKQEILGRAYDDDPRLDDDDWLAPREEECLALTLTLTLTLIGGGVLSLP